MTDSAHADTEMIRAAAKAAVGETIAAAYDRAKAAAAAADPDTT